MGKKKGRAVSVKAGGDISDATCTCTPPMPGMPGPPGPCAITAYGTLIPPDPSLGPGDLEPPYQLIWKIFNSSGALVDTGTVTVNPMLGWALTCANPAFMSGDTYKVQIEPIWLVRVMPVSSRSTTC